MPALVADELRGEALSLSVTQRLIDDLAGLLQEALLRFQLIKMVTNAGNVDWLVLELERREVEKPLSYLLIYFTLLLNLRLESLLHKFQGLSKLLLQLLLNIRLDIIALFLNYSLYTFGDILGERTSSFVLPFKLPNFLCEVQKILCYIHDFEGLSLLLSLFHFSEFSLQVLL